MARSETLYRSFNRGLISDLALARTDVQRVGLSAEIMDNWMARRLGPMMLRPGTAYLASTVSNNKARFIPFVFSFDDKALLELTATTMRVWLNESVVTRSATTTTVLESDFATVTNWTDNDEGGGTSQVTSIGSVDYLELEGDGTNAAIRTQEVSVASAYENTEHGLKVEVGMLDYTTTGNLSGLRPTLRIGTTDGDDDLISEVELDNGNHHFAFTPGVRASSFSSATGRTGRRSFGPVKSSPAGT